MASTPWYATGNLWTAVGAAAAVMAALMAVVLWRMGEPRRKLVYGWRAAGLLYRDSRGALDALTAVFDGAAVADPHLAELWLAIQSRRDVPSGDFDQGRPVVFDLGVPIVKVLSGPGSLRDCSLRLTVDGQSVRVEPQLIRHGTAVRIELLTAGPPELTCESSLVDVAVITSRRRPSAGRARARRSFGDPGRPGAPHWP